jgi:methionyl aminopeptidase
VIKIKTEEQIDGIRHAGSISAGCLDYLEKYVKAGVTTDELNGHAREFIEHHGATCAPLNYKGYPKETCISVNECICHGIPSDRQLLNGDILNIDVTSIKDGYYGDTSRMYSVGTISKEAEELIAATKECLNIGISQVYPENRFGNIGYAIGTYAQSRGYSVVYQFCGHGTGVEFHEEPNIPHIAHKDSGQIMKPGMVFTIEPMINIGAAEALLNEADGWTATTIDGKLSAQFEHTLVVTEEGCEILT